MRNESMNNFRLLLSCFVFVICLHANDKFKIEGLVVDAKKNGIKGVTLYLISANKDTVETKNSGRKGKFKFKKILEGEYVLKGVSKDFGSGGIKLKLKKDIDDLVLTIKPKNNPVAIKNSSNIAEQKKLEKLPQQRNIPEKETLKFEEYFFEYDTDIKQLQLEIDSLKSVVRGYEKKQTMPNVGRDILDLIKIPDYQHRVELQNGTIVSGSLLDESDSTFLKLSSTVSVVTNIDEEHLDHYKNFSNLKKSFTKFITQVPFYGCAIVCSDNKYVNKIISKNTTTKIIKYGFNSDNDIRATNIKFKNNKTNFDIYITDKKNKVKRFNNFSVPLVGKYNVLNALATISVALYVGLKVPQIKKSIASFKGVERRLTHVGTVKNIEIIDDYAHHPTEIHNVISGIRESRPTNNLIAVFQPHRFTRIVSLRKEFSAAFSCSDHVMVSEIYAAGEKKPRNFKLNDLIRNIENKSKTRCSIYINNNSILDLIGQFDGKTTILFLGAGSVTKWAHDFYSLLKRSYE